MDGINALSGYKLVYTDHPNSWTAMGEGDSALNASYSLGLGVGSTGELRDVIIGSVADKAGLAPGFKIVAVNGRAFTPALLRTAIIDSKANASQPIDLIVENTGYYKLVSINYHGGERYPSLERVDGTPARLDDILQPMTK
jgi:predicted metalloprotease with PDZ domain